MAYTGTGSSADPAIPSTITELYKILTDARSGNVNGNTNGPYYIKLTQDIDCANDSNYIGYAGVLNCFGGSVASSVIKIYADTKKYIRGLTVKDDYFIRLMHNNNSYVGTTIQNIDFIDCFFKPMRSGNYNQVPTVFCANSTGSYARIVNSTISINVYGYVDSQNYAPYISYMVGFSNCSVYLKYNSVYGFRSGDGIFNAYTVNTATTNNIFIFDGWYIPRLGTSWDYPICKLGSSCSYNAFIFKNAKFQNPNNIYGLFYGSYNYLAFVNPSLSGTSSSVALQGFSGTSNSIIATDSSAYGTVIIKGSDSSGVGYWLTLDELKSEQKLLDIGFVP